MSVTNIELYNAVVCDIPKDRLPIWYCDLSYFIETKRGNKKSVTRFEIKKFVCKGTIEQIKKDQDIRKRVIIEHFGGGKVGYNKMQKFEATRLKVVGMTIIKSLGFGTK